MSGDGFDMVALSTELLVALRGERSQVAWSRRLGYRSNIAYRWESGRRFPTAAEMMRACARTGIDTRAAMTRFYGHPPPWADTLDPADPRAIATILQDLKGSTPVRVVAERVGVSISTVSRWLSADSQPRLPDFLRCVEAASMRTADFLAVLVDPMSLPSLRPLWIKLEARREGAGRYPWTQAILRALELVDYRALPAHEPGWLSARLGMPREEEDRCVRFLTDTGQIRWDGTRYVHRRLTVDTRRHPSLGRKLKGHWYAEGARRALGGAPGQFSYNVFTCSRADLERIRQAHLRYFHELRSIVGESAPDEVVAVAAVQLFELTGWEPSDP